MTEPSEAFRAYLAPLAIEAGAARVSERWAGVTAWASKGTPAEIPALVAAMRGDDSAEVRAKLQPLISALTNADETFNTLNASQMLRILAAAALDHAFTTSSTLDSASTLAIITSSWGGRVPKGLEVDILARALAELENIAAAARERDQLEIGAPPAPWPSTTPSLTKIKEGEFDQNTVAAAVEEVLKTGAKAFASYVASARSAHMEITRRLEQADEEVNVLWYVFGGISEDGGVSFVDLDSRCAAFFAAREIANMTSRPLRTKASVELFRRCGAKGRKGPFVEAVELIDTDWIAEHVSGDFSPSLFPIHRALVRYATLVEPGAWVAGWSKETGVAAEFRIEPTELALAFYRERLLLMEVG